MNKSALEREYQRVYDSFVWEDYPIHFTGAGLFIINESSVFAATISLDDSPNGTTWTSILFSTHSTSGNLNITLVPNSYTTLLFVSCQQYVRISVDPELPDGLFVHLVQWPPTKVPCVEVGS